MVFEYICQYEIYSLSLVNKELYQLTNPIMKTMKSFLDMRATSYFLPASIYNNDDEELFMENFDINYFPKSKSIRYDSYIKSQNYQPIFLEYQPHLQQLADSLSNFMTDGDILNTKEGGGVRNRDRFIFFNKKLYSFDEPVHHGEFFPLERYPLKYWEDHVDYCEYRIFYYCKDNLRKYIGNNKYNYYIRVHKNGVFFNLCYLHKCEYDHVSYNENYILGIIESDFTMA